MKAHVFVNRHIVRSNIKHGENEAAISVKTYKGSGYGHFFLIANHVLIQDFNRKNGSRIWLAGFFNHTEIAADSKRVAEVKRIGEIQPCIRIKRGNRCGFPTRTLPPKNTGSTCL